MRAQTRPALAVPAGATDCHMHVFGPVDIYPPAARRSYTPRPARLADYRATTDAVGLQRSVFVQASCYGADNRCLVDTLAAAGGRGRGVAVIDDGLGDGDLDRLQEAGVRGVRVNAETFGLRSADVIAGQLTRTAQRAARLGWHVQLFASLPTIADLAPTLATLPAALVIDHMGLASAAGGPRQRGFDALLRLAAGGAWVKLSGADRISSDGPDYADAAPIARALIAANPERMLWGSDWPHTGKHASAAVNGEGAPLIDYRPLDDGRMLRLLGDWTDGDAGLLKAILVDNPAALYGFPSPLGRASRDPECPAANLG